MRHSRERASRGFDAPRVVIACAPLVGFAAFAVLRWADWGASAHRDARGGATELGLWQFLVTAGVFVWVVLAGVGLRVLEGLRAELGAQPHGEGSWATIAFVVFVSVVNATMLAIGAIAGLRNPYVMDGQNWKIPVLHLVAGVAIVPLLVVLKRIQLWAVDDTGWTTTARDVARMRVLRRSMQAATAALGVVIALAVIATGALREATDAAHLQPVPDTFVLVYGAWFTGVVAAIYLHVFGALEARGRWMLETVVPLPDPGSAEEFIAGRSFRSELAQELELGGDPKRNLEALLAVFAPLVGALLTRLGGL